MAEPKRNLGVAKFQNEYGNCIHKTQYHHQLNEFMQSAYRTHFYLMNMHLLEYFGKPLR